MRRRVWISLVVVALLLAADLAWWAVAAEKLRAGIDDWIAAQEEQGWHIRHGTPSLSGWPLRAGVILPDLTLRHPGAAMPGRVDIATAEIVVSVPLYHPTRLSVAFTGPAHVRVGSGQDMIVSSVGAAVTVPLRAVGTALPVRMAARSLRLEPSTGDWRAVADKVRLRLSAGSPPLAATVFDLSAHALTLPAVARWSLGPAINTLSARGTLKGRWPVAPDLVTWAQAWREGGGALAIDHLAFAWGPLGFAGTATLGLDPALQLEGTGEARISGYGAALDRLAETGAMTRGAATAAKAILSLMAAFEPEASAGTPPGHDAPAAPAPSAATPGAAGQSGQKAPTAPETSAPPPDGTAPDTARAIVVPLTLNNRTLSVSQVPILRLPELDWARQ